MLTVSQCLIRSRGPAGEPIVRLGVPVLVRNCRVKGGYARIGLALDATVKIAGRC